MSSEVAQGNFGLIDVDSYSDFDSFFKDFTDNMKEQIRVLKENEAKIKKVRVPALNVSMIGKEVVGKNGK